MRLLLELSSFHFFRGFYFKLIRIYLSASFIKGLSGGFALFVQLHHCCGQGGSPQAKVHERWSSIDHSALSTSFTLSFAQRFEYIKIF